MSIYMQITTRCNMRCGHCAFSCTSRGKDMSRAVFEAGIALVEDYDGSINIGGGEPTLHKHFWDFLGLAIVRGSTETQPFVATNGTVEKSALRLAWLAREGIVCAALSRSRWHQQQKVQPTDRVIDAFSKKYFGEGRGDGREIRVTDYRSLTNQGRARENELGGDNKCSCDALFVTPDGTLYECGCVLVKLGTVFNPEIPEEYWDREEPCSRFFERQHALHA